MIIYAFETREQRSRLEGCDGRDDRRAPLYSDNVRLFVPLDVYDDQQVAEVLMKSDRLCDVLATRHHVIIKGLPVIQVRRRCDNHIKTCRL